MTIKSCSPSNFNDLIELSRDEYSNELSKIDYGEILVVTLPNRFGKTITTLKYFSEQKSKILYLSDRHEQISEVENWENVVHWYGLSKICEKKEDPFIKSLIERDLKANVLCNLCKLHKKSNCAYKKQFELPNDVIVVAPKQFMPTAYVMDKCWDAIIIDENIENSHKIEITYPTISKEVFNLYNIDYELYKEIGKGKNNPQLMDIPKLKEKVRASIKELRRLIKSLKKKDILKTTHEESDLISYLNNLNNSIEWISYAKKYGPKDHFYRPYLHYAFDLRKENNSKIIILNTSLNEWIYATLAKGYEHDLPDPKFYNKKIENRNSLLFKYSLNKRSCSKSAITTELDDELVFGGDYGIDIDDMLTKPISFANNKDLKLGIITFKGLEDEIIRKFSDKIHIIGHFGGHQGSNKFDDVDMLIIIGTYHLPDSVLYLKHYQITGEFLKDNPAKWGNNRIINGSLISLTDNEKFNNVKLYKLNEEQGQAIFRSGAHVNEGKIVIVFGYVPEGIEKTLNYKQFKSGPQLLGLLSRYKQL